jgi:hypothetical protein
LKPVERLGYLQELTTALKGFEASQQGQKNSIEKADVSKHQMKYLFTIKTCNYMNMQRCKGNG